MREYTVQYENCILPRRRRSSHKGDYGRLLLVGGSVGYTGAPVLAAEAALRTGAGLVFVGVPERVYPIVAQKCTCSMPFPLPADLGELEKKAAGCDALLLGPGLGLGEEARQLVLRLSASYPGPLVLDADGINALAGHIDSLDRRQAPTVLGTGPSPPCPAETFLSTPRAIRGWPPAAAATCWRECSPPCWARASSWDGPRIPRCVSTAGRGTWRRNSLASTP